MNVNDPKKRFDEYNYTILNKQNKELFIITDIHGNLRDFKYYLNLLLDDMSNHICFCGDLIHADKIDEDYSLEILDIVKKYIDYPTFHVLMGNHEFAQIMGENAYRYNINQSETVKKLVEEKYPNDYSSKYQEYKKLLLKFNYFIKTDTGLYITHAGIHEDYLESIINGNVDVYHLDVFGDFYHEKLLSESLWCRNYDDYSEKSVDVYLKFMGCKFMISGHTNYNGYHIFGNQLILNSSHNTSNKYYLKVKLDDDYKNINDVVKKLKKG